MQKPTSEKRKKSSLTKKTSLIGSATGDNPIKEIYFKKVLISIKFIELLQFNTTTLFLLSKLKNCTVMSTNFI